MATAVTAVTAAATMIAVAPGATAAPAEKPGATKAQPKTPPLTKRRVHQLPAKRQARGGAGTMSASSGGSSGDFTGDGIKDILARVAGQLRVYPHSGTYNGTSTYSMWSTVGTGWGGISWIGQGRMAGQGGQPRQLSDVLGLETDGNMYVHTHSGTYNGTATLNSKVLISTGWPMGELRFTYDWNGDGWDDVFRRDGAGNTLVYLHSGVFNGTQTLTPPQLVIDGGQSDINQMMADFTGDGSPDLLFLQNYEGDQWMSVYSFAEGAAYTLGYGWGVTNALLVTDINMDGFPDVVARWGPPENGVLKSYRHSGQFVPDPYGRAFGVLLAAVNIGFGWQSIDVIT